MKKLKIEDFRLPVCGKSIFGSFGTGPCDFCQALEKPALLVSKLWKTAFLSLFTTANRQSAIFNRQFFVRFTTANRQTAIGNRQFFINRKFR